MGDGHYNDIRKGTALMAIWLYQMSLKQWTPKKCRLAVQEGKTLVWTVGQIRHRGQGDVVAGDTIVLFFCKTNNSEPGIYGWGKVMDFTDNGSNRRWVTFVVKPPSNRLKGNPCWNHQVDKLIATVHENMPQATLFGASKKEFSHIRALFPKAKLDILIPEEFTEGAPKRIWVNAYERDKEAREACLKAHGYACRVCETNLADVYGKIGKDWIHVHHFKQVAQQGGPYKLDPEKDLCPVCPNCHAMIHRREKPFTIEELRKRMLIAASQKSC